MSRADRAYELTSYQGFRVDRRTKSALRYCQKRFRRATGRRFELAQGSYNAGGVAASAGTHDSGGVVDIRVTPLTKHQANYVLALLKQTGFAAWARPNAPGLWGPHIHAVLIGHRVMSPVAVDQVSDFDAGLDGLASHRPDPSPRPDPPVKWSHKRRRPVER